MKLTNILTHYLITLHCTADTSKATDAPTTGDQSQHPTDSLTSPINYDNSYIQNYNSIIQAIFKLAQDKSITLNNMIAKITEWMRLNKRDKLFKKDDAKLICISEDIVELYSKLSNLKLKEYVCPGIQSSLELLGAVIEQGRKDGFFDYERKDGVIPYGSIVENLYVFLEMTKAKLDEITVDKHHSTKYDEIKRNINCNANEISNWIRDINIGCEKLVVFINQSPFDNISSLLETQEFKNFCSSLHNRNLGLRSAFNKLFLDYLALFRLNEAKLKDFFKDNSDLFHYALSASDALISMNVFLIDFRHLNVLPEKTIKIPHEFCDSPIWPDEFMPGNNVVFDLAVKLILFCVKNDEIIFENLKNRGFAVGSLELAAYKGENNKAKNNHSKVLSHKAAMIIALSGLIIAVFASAFI